MAVRQEATATGNYATESLCSEDTHNNPFRDEIGICTCSQWFL
jgi:hypothetical protein